MKTDEVSGKYSGDAQVWLQWADQTYAGSRTLFESENPLLWFPAAILGHHALELYLKAALIRTGHRVGRSDIWGHDLAELAATLEHKLTTPFPGLTAGLQVFSSYFDELRYPSELRKVDGLGQQEESLLNELVQTLRPYAANEVA